MSESPGGRERPLVLLVEDELSIAEIMAMILQAEEYTVVTAANGREGLEQLNRDRPDLIITDYMMPEMTGSEMIEEIKRNPEWRDIPILLMSAALPHQLPAQGLANRFLTKGGDLETLLGTICELIRGSKK